MNENQWWACEDVAAMLAFLRERASGRKLRLFAAACARHAAVRLPPDPGLRAIIELAERLADGAATEAERATALQSSWRGGDGGALARALLYGDADILTAGDPDCTPRPAAPGTASYYGAQLAAERLATIPPGDEASPGWAVAVLRCLVGNPFRPVPPLSSAVLRWNDSLVPRLARAIYDEQRWGDLPLLADALLDAGCADEGLMAHCRSGALHVRGCFAVDAILGLG